uniref:Uncharacterized protein n=1 Tax=Anguilla anguilla TaxID=7936 RepID=A0A0E9WWJ1_ANGAN
MYMDTHTQHTHTHTHTHTTCINTFISGWHVPSQCSVTSGDCPSSLMPCNQCLEKQIRTE